MRPCISCRIPIENRVVTCPYCGASQGGGLKANPAPEPVTPGFFLRVLGLFDFGGSDPFFGLFVFVLPIVLGGVIGYSTGGLNGAVVGMFVAFAAVITAAALLAASQAGG